MLQSKKSKKKINATNEIPALMLLNYNRTQISKKNEKWKIENYILSIINLESLFF